MYLSSYRDEFDEECLLIEIGEDGGIAARLSND